eukprot:Gb_32857 [translate_table: standard]
MHDFSTLVCILSKVRVSLHLSANTLHLCAPAVNFPCPLISFLRPGAVFFVSFKVLSVLDSRSMVRSCVSPTNCTTPSTITSKLLGGMLVKDYNKTFSARHISCSLPASIA